MWPIGLVVVGTVAARVGASTAAAVGRLRTKGALAAVALLVFLVDGLVLVLALTRSW